MNKNIKYFLSKLSKSLLFTNTKDATEKNF